MAKVVSCEGAENDTRSGWVTAVATPLHRGGRLATYDVAITDDDGNNLFADDSAEDGISDLARSVIGGSVAPSDLDRLPAA